MELSFNHPYPPIDHLLFAFCLELWCYIGLYQGYIMSGESQSLSKDDVYLRFFEEKIKFVSFFIF